MITAELAADIALGRLGRMPQTVRDGLKLAVGDLSQQLRDRVQRKLSGAVLRRRSGRLASSVTIDVTQSGGAIGASLSSDIEYAAIHEYGGTLPAREVLPGSARALAFPWKGQQRFFARVEIPSVAMPQRSFLRSTLDEMAPAIEAALTEAVHRAVQT